MDEKKERLDVLLVEKGLYETREKARQNIMAGLIFINNVRFDKCGDRVNKDSIIEIKGNAIPYVSRGGLKLEKALKDFDLKLDGKVCMDIGASTGGFTDCMLKNGATKVFAVDVGYGQFAWELRQDKRVVCMERTNIRYVKPEDIGCLLDFASIDVSFISLKLVIPVVRELLKENGEVVALIKPQFEAGRDKVGKKGVVREISTHLEVVENIVDFAYKNGFNVRNITYSPIKGPEGNIEYLVYIIKQNITLDSINKNTIKDIICESHESLNK